MQTSNSPSLIIPNIYSILYHEEEFPKYNIYLKNTTDKIQDLIQQNPQLLEDGKKAIQHLEHQIQTNNHYVSKRKEEIEAFSLLYCFRMKDIVGFNYLLRVGENPQQAVFKQKTIIELVQRKGLEDFNQAISQYFKAMTLQQLQ